MGVNWMDKRDKMIKKYSGNNRLRAFIDEVNQIYNTMPHDGLGGLRVPNAEQRKQIFELARKHARSEDEAKLFVDYARKLWEVDIFG